MSGWVLTAGRDPVPFPGTHCPGQSGTIPWAWGFLRGGLGCPAINLPRGADPRSSFKVRFMSLPWLPYSALQDTGWCIGLPSQGGLVTCQQ